MTLKAILTMPSVGSWNGVWHSQIKEFSKSVTVTKGVIPEETYAKLKRGETISGHYNFGDGWVAEIAIKLKGKDKTTGRFSSYSWMIKTLLKDGFIHTDYENKDYSGIRIK